MLKNSHKNGDKTVIIKYLFFLGGELDKSHHSKRDWLTKADLQKNYSGRGHYFNFNFQTDIADSRLNGPSGQFSRNGKILISFKEIVSGVSKYLFSCILYIAVQ